MKDAHEKLVKHLTVLFVDMQHLQNWFEQHFISDEEITLFSMME